MDEDVLLLIVPAAVLFAVLFAALFLGFRGIRGKPRLRK